MNKYIFLNEKGEPIFECLAANLEAATIQLDFVKGTRHYHGIEIIHSDSLNNKCTSY